MALYIPSQHFPFGAAFVCQTGKVWTLLHIYTYIFCNIKAGKQLKFALSMYVFISFKIKIICLNLPYNKLIF